MTLTENRPSITIRLCVLAGLVGLFAVSGGWYINAIRPPKLINLHDIALNDAAKESFDPDPAYLRTLPAPEAVRHHLLDGEFTIVHRLENISQSCRMPLESSFVRSSKTGAMKLQIDFADPGQEFVSGDVLIEGLPFRQLHFAGMGSGSCFVYYEQGGRNYSSSCLAVVNYSTGKTIWVGVTHHKRARDLRELRYFLFADQFDDNGGRDC